jgi:hypothetical protein
MEGKGEGGREKDDKDGLEKEIRIARERRKGEMSLTCERRA